MMDKGLLLMQVSIEGGRIACDGAEDLVYLELCIDKR